MGAWGILRAYRGQAPDLAPLPTNKEMAAPKDSATNIKKFLDNQVALGTRLDQYHRGSFLALADAYGIDGCQFDGNNVLDAYAAVKIAADAIWGMVTIGIILGGILSGIFTPTESGAVACIYAFLVTMFVYRDVKWSEVPKLIARVVRTVGMVMIMIGFSIAFGYMMAIMRIPAKVTEFFVAISSDKYTFLLYVNVLLLLLGTFMDLAPMLLICTPIFLPVIKTFGIDPVHFGIIMILNLGIGLLTPPVGPTMVVGCAIGRVSMEAVSRSILIFYVPMLIVLALVTYIPALSLWLPNLLLK